MPIQWPDLRFPPINLWNAPVLMLYLRVTLPQRRARPPRADDPQAVIERLCRDR